MENRGGTISVRISPAEETKFIVGRLAAGVLNASDDMTPLTLLRSG